MSWSLAERFSNLAALLDGFCEVAEAVDPEAPYPQWLCAMLYHVRGFGEQLDEYMIEVEGRLRAAGVPITAYELAQQEGEEDAQDDAQDDLHEEVQDEEEAEAVH
jgi:hypothetical protein